MSLRRKQSRHEIGIGQWLYFTLHRAVVLVQQVRRRARGSKEDGIDYLGQVLAG